MILITFAIIKSDNNPKTLRYGLNNEARVPTLGLLHGPVQEVIGLGRFCWILDAFVGFRGLLLDFGGFYWILGPFAGFWGHLLDFGGFC